VLEKHDLASERV